MAYGESWVLVARERPSLAAHLRYIQACSSLGSPLRTQPTLSIWDAGGRGTLSTISDFVSFGGKGVGRGRQVHWRMTVSSNKHFNKSEHTAAGEGAVPSVGGRKAFGREELELEGAKVSGGHGARPALRQREARPGGSDGH